MIDYKDVDKKLNVDGMDAKVAKCIFQGSHHYALLMKMKINKMEIENYEL